MLFGDIKGSTELIEGLAPEEARTLLDPALHHMMEAVHRYEGTVNQVLATVSWRCSELRAPMKTMPSGRVTRLWRCRTPCATMLMKFVEPTRSRCRSGWDSIPGKWWSGRSITIYTWTTRRWGKRPTWRLAYHALRGEEWEKAVAYFHRAGTKAATRSAYREAFVCFEQAGTELFTAIELCGDMEMMFWLARAEAALAQVENRK